MEPLAKDPAHYDPYRAQKKGYSSLYGRFIILTLVCSVIPLLLVCWSIYVYYSHFSADRMIEYFQSQVQHHQRLIELFFKERASDLQLIALSNSLDDLSDKKHLEHIFDVINRDNSLFEDLGVLNDEGRHIAYVGPFDLMDKDYSKTFWFREVMEKHVYISDVFLGYRDTPHFIIAVTSSEAGRMWILRATINTEFFRSLVENVTMGKTGEVYLVNRDGLLQTSPQFGGKVLDKAFLPMQLFTELSGIKILDDVEHESQRFPRQIVAYTWLAEPQWMLVVKQDYSEVFRQVNHANRAMLIFLHISIVAILLVSIVTTRHMVSVVKKRDEETHELNRQLVQASKLASLGELAAGVAHEINNPLAIILTGTQIARDLCDEYASLDAEFKNNLFDFLSQTDTQVLRCNTITHNLLRFSRRTRSVIEKVDLNGCIEEVVELLEKRAQSCGVSIHRDLDKNLPAFLSDPSQLQQVFVNLIANAIDAHESKLYGAIHVATRANEKGSGVEVMVSDTGVGIPAENLERIFDPFFTTKPVGKGTGLGLSISYSIIKNLRGDIRVQSNVDKGTDFTIFLPFLSPDDFRDSHPQSKRS